MAGLLIWVCILGFFYLKFKMGKSFMFSYITAFIGAAFVALIFSGGGHSTNTYPPRISESQQQHQNDLKMAIDSVSPYTPNKVQGASAKCADGTTTLSKNRQGACSYHGGLR